ncbi:MAG: Rho termination factor N-terminal domain-containing protein [Rhodovibrionaceae bacterium]
MARGDNSVKDEKTYKELRKKGAGKEKAARIANAKANSKQKPSKKGGKASSYEERTVEELRKQAAKLGIAGRSKMKKAELIGALRSR